MLKVEQSGFSLIELMVTVAIIGIVAAVSIPMYQDYSDNARVAVLQNSIQTIRLMQSDKRLEDGEFVEGSYVPGGTTTLTSRLGWSPNANVDEVTYVVACTTVSATNPGECTRTSGYTVTATHAAYPNEPVVQTFQP